MRRLPLWPETPRAAVQRAEPLPLDPKCSRCKLAEAGGARRCIGAEDQGTGGLLIVGEGPGREEDTAGRPFIGRTGQKLRSFLAKHWSGPVVLDSATRCFPGVKQVKEQHINSCRGYLSATLNEVRPKRIIALGLAAAKAVVGRGVSAAWTRKAYSWLHTEWGSVPVFFVVHPSAAIRNRFVDRVFEEDLRWALEADPPAPDLDGSYLEIETEEDARAAVGILSAAEWSAFDVETAGRVHAPEFRMLTLAACPRDGETPFVWGEQALKPGAPARGPLLAWLRNWHARKVGSNVAFDEVACGLALGAEPLGVRGDVRLWRKLVDVDADGHLDAMADLVGLGHIKEEAEREAEIHVGLVAKGLAAERRLARNSVEDEALVAGGKRARKRSPLDSRSLEGLALLRWWDQVDPSISALMRDDEVDQEVWQYAVIPESIRIRYCARDVLATARVGEWGEAAMAAVPSIDRVRRQVVDPASRALPWLARWGVPIAPDNVRAFDAYLGIQIRAALEKLRPHIEGTALTWGEFNPRSVLQVRTLLYNVLGLAPLRGKETETGQWSTDDEVLSAYAPHHPAAAALLEFRRYETLQKNGGAGLLRFCRPALGRAGMWRVHPFIDLSGAATGRASCSSPNMQNKARANTAEGKMGRDCFAADPGWRLLELDFSQVELRHAAALSGDKVMIARFNSGEDFHLTTAKTISRVVWGIDPDQITDEHRTLAKSVIFGLIYGKTARTLAREWGVPLAVAEKIVAAIIGQFQDLAAWMQQRIVETTTTGYAWTYWQGERARRRPLFKIADRDDGAVAHARNAAVNNPIQGGANEFCEASIAKGVDWILAEGLRDEVQLVLPVHDSLLFHVREDRVEETLVEVRGIMTSWDNGPVPLVVDAKVGSAWGSMQKIA